LCRTDSENSLIEHYPNYERTLRESLRALVGEEIEKRVDIGLAKDGSGVGGMSPSRWKVVILRLMVMIFSRPVCSTSLEAMIEKQQTNISIYQCFLTLRTCNLLYIGVFFGGPS
jgi:hypothetical protein